MVNKGKTMENHKSYDDRNPSKKNASFILIYTLGLISYLSDQTVNIYHLKIY